MAGWHHRLDGHEFGWTLGVGDGQGGLVCCDSWGHKESDTTEALKSTEQALYVMVLSPVDILFKNLGMQVEVNEISKKEKFWREKCMSV